MGFQKASEGVLFSVVYEKAVFNLFGKQRISKVRLDGIVCEFLVEVSISRHGIVCVCF